MAVENTLYRPWIHDRNKDNAKANSANLVAQLSQVSTYNV